MSDDTPGKSTDSVATNRAALLKARLERRHKKHHAAPPPALEEKPSSWPIPINPMQRPIWLDYQLYPKRRAAWMVKGLELETSIDSDRLRTALNALSVRHPLLCASVQRDGLMHASDAQIPLHRITVQDKDTAWQVAKTHCSNFLPLFELEQGQLLQLYYFEAARQSVIVLVAHHILLDQAGLQIIVNELDNFYKDPLATRTQCRDLGQSYAELYARVSASKKSTQAYWQQQLMDLGRLPPLPFSRSIGGTHDASQGNDHGCLIEYPLTKNLLDDACNKAASFGITPFQWLLSVWIVLLARVSQQPDISVGSLFSLQQERETADVPGYFQNLVVLRQPLQHLATFVDVATAIRHTVSEAIANRELPIDELVRSLGASQPGSHLFATAFIVQGTARREQWLGQQVLRESSLDYGGCTFSLSFFVDIDPRQPGLAIEFDRRLFDSSDISAIFSLYETLLLQCNNRPQLAWRHYSLLSKQQRDQQTRHWHDILEHPPADMRLHTRFDELALQNPQSTAIVHCQPGQELNSSYKDLSLMADAIAQRVAAEATPLDQPVALISSWSIPAIAAMIGIQRAGRAYLPIDPAYPTERIVHSLKDSGAALALSDRVHPWQQGTNLKYALLKDAMAATPELKRKAAPGSELAYVIYTSGSSGPPKGVQISHRAAVYSTRQREAVYGNWPPARFLMLSSIAFDSAVAGLWWTLSSGGTLYLPAEGAQRSADTMAAMLIDKSISHTLCLPGQWYNICRLASTPMKNLQLAIVAGEACHSNVVEQHYKTAAGSQLFNEYGPTEMTVWSTYQQLSSRLREPVSIGKTLSGTQALIVDEQGELLPDGISGELILAGYGIAEGYVDSNSSDKSGFIQHPLDSMSQAYRTGDRAHFSEDGHLFYEGRVDQQVKCRGVRVSLENVESVLSSAISGQVAVVPWQGESLETMLAHLAPAEISRLLDSIDKQ